jgi:hypothetical protein
MTEQEWLSSERSSEMLDFLSGRPGATYLGPGSLEPKRRISERKLRLFFCACCRQVWHLILYKRNRKIVEDSERYADGLEDIKTLQKHQSWLYSGATHSKVWSLVYAACDTDTNKSDVSAARDKVIPPATQAAILREIVGNPFQRNLYWSDKHLRKPAPMPDGKGWDVWCVDHWLTPTVLSIAQGIYEDRSFEELPILADCLEDNGCDEEILLKHLRTLSRRVPERYDESTKTYYGSGMENVTHFLGCWALDLLLGKE